MNQVIVYALSGTMKESMEYIKDRFEIVGFSDTNPEKAELVINEKAKYYLPEELPDLSFDFIIITSVFDGEIKDYLVNHIGIKEEKVLLMSQWQHILIKKEFGTKNPEKTFYVVNRQIRKKNGLFAIIYGYVEQMRYVEKNKYIPVMDMQNYKNQYLDDADLGKKNAWENYFTPYTDVSIEEVFQSKNVILGYDAAEYFHEIQTIDFEELHRLWEKYVRLNKRTADYIEKEYKRLLTGKGKILGALYRGTDMQQLKLKNHAVQPDIQEFIKNLHKKLDEWKCDYIFLCTEDVGALEEFKKEFGNKLIYTNQQRFEKTEKKWLAEIEFCRDNDRYLRGLEYLTAISLLAKCNCLVTGISNGAVGAMILNGNRYENIEIINKGFYE